MVNIGNKIMEEKIIMKKNMIKRRIISIIKEIKNRSIIKGGDMATTMTIMTIRLKGKILKNHIDKKLGINKEINLILQNLMKLKIHKQNISITKIEEKEISKKRNNLQHNSKTLKKTNKNLNKAKKN